MDASHIIVGKLGKTQGLTGVMRINSFTKPHTNVFNYQPWYVQETPYKVSHWQLQGKVLDAKLEGIDHIDQAKILTDQEIYVPKAQLPPPEPGEYYWDDLVGLRVINHENIVLGEIDFLTEGAQFDLVVVKRPNKSPLCIPYEKDAITKVDLPNKTLHVHWDDIED